MFASSWSHGKNVMRVQDSPNLFVICQINKIDIGVFIHQTYVPCYHSQYKKQSLVQGQTKPLGVEFPMVS